MSRMVSELHINNLYSAVVALLVPLNSSFHISTVLACATDLW